MPACQHPFRSARPYARAHCAGIVALNWAVVGRRQCRAIDGEAAARTLKGAAPHAAHKLQPRADKLGAERIQQHTGEPCRQYERLMHAMSAYRSIFPHGMRNHSAMLFAFEVAPTACQSKTNINVTIRRKQIGKITSVS